MVIHTRGEKKRVNNNESLKLWEKSVEKLHSSCIVFKAEIPPSFATVSRRSFTRLINLPTPHVFNALEITRTKKFSPTIITGSKSLRQITFSSKRDT